MNDLILTLLKALGLSKAGAAAGFFGALIALLWSPPKKIRESLAVLLVGIFLCGYGSTFAQTHWDWGVGAISTMSFATGMAGSQVLQTFHEKSPTLVNELFERIKLFINPNYKNRGNGNKSN